jgi:hypothetical protein
VNGKAFVGNQITEFSKENFLFGADLRNLPLYPDIAKSGNPFL